MRALPLGSIGLPACLSFACVGDSPAVYLTHGHVAFTLASSVYQTNLSTADIAALHAGSFAKCH